MEKCYLSSKSSEDVSYSNFVGAKISYRHPLWFVLKAELILHKAAILD
jgi:hypothetical protein